MPTATLLELNEPQLCCQGKNRIECLVNQNGGSSVEGLGHRLTESRVSEMESQGAVQEEVGTKEKLHERNGGSIMSPTDLALKLSPDLFTSS